MLHRSTLFTLSAVVLLPLTLSAEPPKQRVDAHGYPLPEGALARLGSLDMVHPGGINALAISPDGKLVVTAGNDPGVFPADGIDFDGPRNAPVGVRLGRTFSTGGTGLVLVWDATRGKQLHQLPTSAGAWSAPTFSPDGEQLALGDSYGNVQFWDPRTGQTVGSHLQIGNSLLAGTGELPGVMDLQFLQSKEQILTQHRGLRVQSWDLKNARSLKLWGFNWYKQLVARAEGTGAYFIAIAATPDGKRMAWALVSFERGARIQPRTRCYLYESETNKLLLKTDNRPGFISRLLFSPDGKALAAMTEQELWLWDAATGKVRWACKESDRLGGFAFLGEAGKTLATVNGHEVVMRDTQTGRELERHRWPCDRFAASRDGQILAGGAGTRVLLWNRRTQKQPPRLEQHFGAPQLAFDRQGKLFTVGTGWLQIWDARTGKQRERSVLPNRADFLSFDPERRWGLCHVDDLNHKSESAKPQADIRDLMTGRLVARLDGVDLSQTTGQVAWQGGIIPRLIQDGAKGSILCQDLLSGKELSRVQLSSEPEERRAFSRGISPDGRWLVDAGIEGPLRVFASRTEKLVWTLSLPRAEHLGEAGDLLTNEGAPVGSRSLRLWALTFSSSSRYLLASYHTPAVAAPLASIWDLETGQEMRRLMHSPSHQLTSMGQTTFSPDNRFLAVANQPGLIDIFEIASGSKRGALSGAFASLRGLAFSPDGTILASSHDDSTVLTWDLNRPLTAQVPKTSAFSEEDLERLWQNLGSPAGDKGEAAIWTLVRAPGLGVQLLKERLHPTPLTTTAQIQGLIDDLDSRKFRVRQGAIQRLTELGELVLPALKTTLARKNRPLEVEQRLRLLITRLDNPQEPSPCLREQRAIEVLERIGNAEARAVLRTLTTGAPLARVTSEARGALARLEQDRH